MPWDEVTRVSLREEFIRLALLPGANRRELCRRFRVAPKTGYKWLRRHAQEGASGLQDRSRRPHHSPKRTAAAIEQKVIGLRLESRGCWGGRKLSRQLAAEAGTVLAPSTVTEILRRAHLLDPAVAAGQLAWQRFARPTPNELWQMDYKGHFPLFTSGRCHPLTVLDDCSRFSIALTACADERDATVRTVLREAFRRYGLPSQMLMDNGPPWGTGGTGDNFTALSVWLLRLGIRITHGRPFHPQTQGKDERFHRTLKFELLRHIHFTSLAHCQCEFDRFRNRYNQLRPHDALALATPASCYRPSPIPFPETPPPLEYPCGLPVRKVQDQGWFSYRGRSFRVSKAFRGWPVALRPLESSDSQREVLFANQVIALIDLNQTNDHPTTR